MLNITTFATLLVLCGIVCAFNVASEPFSPQDGAEVPPDPQGKDYATGAKPISSDTLSKLRVKQRFRAYLPDHVDLSVNIPKPGDQGSLGSCASWAVGYAARSYYTKVLEHKDLIDANIPSPRYLYHAARSGSCDGGSSFEENVRVLQRGAYSLKDVPYSASCSNVAPNTKAVIGNFSVEGLETLNTIGPAEIRGQLSIGNPVLISMRVNKAFKNLRRHDLFADKSKEFSNSEGTSWHAMAIVGYDDHMQAVRVINSWGRGWGNKGYAWVSYDLVADPFWVREAFVLSVSRSESHSEDEKPSPAFEPVTPRSQIDLEKYLKEMNPLKCAKLSSRTLGDRREVFGHVASSEDLDIIRRSFERDRSVSLEQVSIIPWPACEILETLDGALQAVDRPSIDIGSRKTFYSGDNFGIKIRSTKQFSYLYVSYLQADGTVVHLAQPQGLIPAQTSPEAYIAFGDGTQGRARFIVSRPYGFETVVTIASKSPLFDRELPSVQTDREFLTALKKALIYKPIPSASGRIVSAAMEIVKTKEKLND